MTSASHSCSTYEQHGDNNTDFEGGNARLSVDGRYRYYLTRYWDRVEDPSERVTWVMLNPSTADANIDDQTIKRCKHYSRFWGYKGLAVVNIFALRATQPTQLVGDSDPIGPCNDEHIRYWLELSGLVMAAWGASWPKQHARRVADVVQMLAPYDPHCLGVTKTGQPWHPSRLGNELRPQEWRP
jgi:hypothetical protein